MLKFVRQSAIAEGSFNIYIFVPEWVAEIEDCQLDPAEAEFGGDLTRAGIWVHDEKFTADWEIRPDSLQLSATDAAADCGTVLARALAKLPETPVSGIQFRFMWSTDDANCCSEPLTACRSEFAVEHGLEVGRIVSGRLDDGAEATIFLRQRGLGAEVVGVVNQQIDDAPTGAEYARKFLDARREVIAWTSKVLNVALATETQSSDTQTKESQ